MKLYKLRSLNNFERVLDIVLNERLYCSPFQDLNDPFEGIFLAVSHLPPVVLQSKGAWRHEFRDVSGLYDYDQYNRVCSLSRSFKDIRLWSHYAEGHRGVAIEIDFAGHEKDIFPVKYLTELKRYSDTILGSPFADEVLRHKTVHWQYEDEVRIVQAEPYYPVLGRITSVYLGARISEDHKCMLDKVLPDHIPMIDTKIHEVTLEIVPDTPFQRKGSMAVCPQHSIVSHCDETS